MTDEQQPPEIINGSLETPKEKEEDWAMRNKIIIWIVAFIVLKFLFEYMGWLHH